MMSFNKKNNNVINLIKNEYLKDDNIWYLGFSGGKDSSATLKLVFSAIKDLEKFHKDIFVIFCDTGVENPIITNYVYKLFEDLKEESALFNLPFKFEIVKPKLENRFFVKVIGRGYPTPTNIFRWCTNKLRVEPINLFINSSAKSTIILGVRINESEQRNRTIEKNKTELDFYLKQNNSANKIIFSPILFHDLEEVWMTINSIEFPRSIVSQTVRKIYSDAESECSSVRVSGNGKACGSSRFGCWTCTVVRKDKSTANQIDNGYTELIDLHNFRNWISEFRDNLEYRCSYRRNGVKSLGPITLEGRKIILKKLLDIQSRSKFVLIEEDEIDYIKVLWTKDLENPNYREN